MYEITLPSLHTKQQIIADDPARFKVLACGRRWGKTRLACIMCLLKALEGGTVWWVGPVYKIAEVGWRTLKILSSQIPNVTIREGDRQIIFHDTGGWIEVKSADSADNLRGEGLDFLAMDEAAFIQESVWTEILRPSLADKKGSAIFMSTPNGLNWFYALWQRGQHDTKGIWKSWRLPTATNPYIDPQEIEDAKNESSNDLIFRQEFLADFVSDAGAVFRNLDDCAVIEDPQEGAIDGHAYVIGVDWGQVTDFTVFSVIDATTLSQAFLERTNHTDFKVLCNRLVQVAKRFRADTVIPEINSIGRPNIEELIRLDLPIQPFTTTLGSKKKIVDGLALAFDRKMIKILKDRQQLQELQVFAPHKTATGMYTYNAPVGSHDDCVLALALAWSGVEAGMFEVSQIYHMQTCIKCGRTTPVPPWFKNSWISCTHCGSKLDVYRPEMDREKIEEGSDYNPWMEAYGLTQDGMAQNLDHIRRWSGHDPADQFGFPTGLPFPLFKG